MSKQKKPNRVSKRPSTDLISSPQFQTNSSDRVLYLIFNSIGSKVQILLNSGDSLTGTLQNVDPRTYDIVVDVDGVTNLLKFDELVDFEIFDIDLFTKSKLATTSKFKTDVDISNNSNQRRSEMEKWVPDSSAVGSLPLNSLSLHDDNSNWDQFQVNEERFGIKSEFDEDLYTTRINKSDPNYLKNLEIATKLAKEIENQSFTGNVHLAEERNLKFDDSGVDEEDKYSGVDRQAGAAATVQRTSSISKGDALFNSLIHKEKKTFAFNTEANKAPKYVPPSQRGRLQNIDDSIISAEKPAEKPLAETLPEKPIVQKPAETLVEKPIPIEKVAGKPVVIKSDKTKSGKHSLNFNSRNELNSLKEFSENFKIPTKFPEDLLPIVTKDKTKQEAIIKKNESVEKIPESTTKPVEKTVKPVEEVGEPIKKVEKVVKPIEKAEEAPKPTEASKAQEKPAPEAKQTKTEPPAKVEEKKNFKLNPKAASFTPTFAPSSIGSPLSGISSPSFQRNSPRLNNKRHLHVQPSAFFPPSKIPNLERPRSFNEELNFFKGCLNEYNKKETTTKFRLEKPFSTPPTWSVQTDDYVKSYKTLFPDIKLPLVPPPVPINQIPSPYQQQMYPIQQRFISPMHSHPQQIIYQQNLNQFQPIPMMQQSGIPMPQNQQNQGGFIPMNVNQDFYQQQQRINQNSNRFNNQNNFIPGGFNNHQLPQNHGRIQGGYNKNH